MCQEKAGRTARLPKMPLKVRTADWVGQESRRAIEGHYMDELETTMEIRPLVLLLPVGNRYCEQPDLVSFLDQVNGRHNASPGAE